MSLYATTAEEGKPVAELCDEHQISRAQYYQGWDQFPVHAAKAFEVHEQSQREARLMKENAQLKTPERRGQVSPSVAQRNQGLLLMREPHLLVSPNLKLKAKWIPTGSKPKPTRPNEWWGIEMTKGLVYGFGWVYIMVVLDWYTKKIVGHDAGSQGTSQHGLSALNMAVNHQLTKGAQGQGLSFMSDNGCQPTSAAIHGTHFTAA